MNFSRKQYRQYQLIAVLGSGVAAFIFLAWPLLFGHVYFGLDLSLIDVPVNFVLQQHLNHYQGFALTTLLDNGGPLMTRPSAQFFYPIRWIFLAFSPEMASSLFTITHIAIAASGASFLFLTYRGRPWLAFFVGLIFSMSGPVLNLLVHTNIFVTGAAYLPWAWAWSRKSLKYNNKFYYFIGLWLSLSFMLLGGEPQSFLIAAVIITMETANIAIGKKNLRRALPVFLIIFSSFLSGLLLWGPFWGESAFLGRRLSGLPSAESFTWSFTTPLWLQMFLHPLAETSSQWSFFLKLFTNDPMTWNPNPYLGVLVIALVIPALFLRRNRTLTIISVLSLIVSTGNSFPLLGSLLSKISVLHAQSLKDISV